MSWEDKGSKWVNFDKNLNNKLENARDNGDNWVKFDIESYSYSIN